MEQITIPRLILFPNPTIIESINALAQGLAIVPLWPSADLAIDLQPSTGAIDRGVGLAHIDICNTNITADYDWTSVPMTYETIGIGEEGAFLGVLAGHGAPLMPLNFEMGGTICACLSNNGVFDFIKARASNFDVGFFTPAYAAAGQLEIMGDPNPIRTEECMLLTMSTAEHGGAQIPELMQGVTTAGTYGFLQSAARGTSFTTVPLVLQTNGGLVGVGTTIPVATLSVNGNITATGGYFQQLISVNGSFIASVTNSFILEGANTNSQITIPSRDVCRRWVHTRG